MADPRYEITDFRPEHETQVLDLLGVLWKHDQETRAQLFRLHPLNDSRVEFGRFGGVLIADGPRP